jgi:hypothetical protein
VGSSQRQWRCQCPRSLLWSGLMIRQACLPFVLNLGNFPSQVDDREEYTPLSWAIFLRSLRELDTAAFKQRRSDFVQCESTQKQPQILRLRLRMTALRRVPHSTSIAAATFAQDGRGLRRFCRPYGAWTFSSCSPRTAPSPSTSLRVRVVLGYLPALLQGARYGSFQAAEE